MIKTPKVIQRVINDEKASIIDITLTKRSHYKVSIKTPRGRTGMTMAPNFQTGHGNDPRAMENWRHQLRRMIKELDGQQTDKPQGHRRHS